MWGEAPIDCEDIYEIFAKYVEGIDRILFSWIMDSIQMNLSSLYKYRSFYCTLLSENPHFSK